MNQPNLLTEGIESESKKDREIAAVAYDSVSDFRIVNPEDLVDLARSRKLPNAFTRVGNNPIASAYLKQMLLESALTNIRSTVDGEPISEEDEALFLFACLLGTVSDSDRQTFCEKFVTARLREFEGDSHGSFVDDLELALSELTRTGVIDVRMCESLRTHFLTEAVVKDCLAHEGTEESES